MPREGSMAELCRLLIARVGAHLQMGFYLMLQIPGKTRGAVVNPGDVTATVGQQEGEATRMKDIFPFSSFEYTLLF